MPESPFPRAASRLAIRLAPCLACLAAAFCLAAPAPALAQTSAAECPDVQLFTGRAGTGTFVEVVEGDYYHMLVKLDSGEEMDFVPGNDAVYKFGAPKGTKVEFTWGASQSYDSENRSCDRLNTLESIKWAK
jgi:hypothetical protein